jgi:GNAT superfamily N-acetyltransferase
MTDVRLEPMTVDEYRRWRAEVEAGYARSITESGRSAGGATREADDALSRVLPDGFGTAGHHFWYAYDGDRRVGSLWIEATDATAFVYDIAVEADVRRRGYGRAIMLAAERWCHDNAVTRIALHVFAHNTGARALYEQLGFVETGRNMAKHLS